MVQSDNDGFGFIDSVKLKYSKDLIMNEFIMILVLLMPLILYLIVMYLLPVIGGRFDVLVDYEGTTRMVLMCFQYLVIAIVVYRMYMRLRNHSKRDVRWRSTLIEYLESKGAKCDKLKSSHEYIVKKEKFHEFIPATVIFMAIFISIAFFLTVFIPDMEANGYEPTYEINAWVSENILRYTFEVTSGSDLQTDLFYSIQQVELVMLALLLLTVVFKVISFPEGHEERQIGFTEHTAKAFHEIGMGYVTPMTWAVDHNTSELNIRYDDSFLKAMIARIRFGVSKMSSRVFNVFKGGNEHLLNQWTYEKALLRAMDGRMFSYTKYSRMRKDIVKDNKMPVLLIAAEIFVLILCAMYCLKVLESEYDMISDYGSFVLVPESIDFTQVGAWWSLVMIVVNMFLMMGTMDALLGIASRRPKSWKKVATSCLMFVIPIWFGELVSNNTGLAHVFDMNPYITTGILYNLLLFMLLSVSIKEFYTPVGMDMPGIGTWVRYMLWGSLEKKDDPLKESYDDFEDLIFGDDPVTDGNDSKKPGS